MTPKAKAIELVNIYWGKGITNDKEIAKQCALITVNEILNNFGSRLEGNTHYCNYSTIQFYQEVKQEIKKL